MPLLGLKWHGKLLADRVTECIQLVVIAAYTPLSTCRVLGVENVQFFIDFEMMLTITVTPDVFWGFRIDS